jgi:hypothetical protein
MLTKSPIKQRLLFASVLAVCAISTACLILIPGQIRAKHFAALVLTSDSLRVALSGLQQNGKFTNIESGICHVYGITNRYSVSGIFYECALAADAWDYRDRSNLLAITTNGVVLFIDKHGAVLMNTRKVNVADRLPGY